MPEPEFEYPRLGQTWSGRFEILREIGHEAGGKVYQAQDREGNQVVALWILPPEVVAHANIPALMQEVETIRRLDQKNLVLARGCRLEEGGLGIWMEYVDGKRLSDHIANKKKVTTNPAFSYKGAYNLIAHLLAGLAAAHPAVIHGALSPASILTDNRGRVRLLGLGLSRHLPRNSHSNLFQAPEANPGPAADIYSVALIFTELVTGRTGSAALNLLSPAFKEVISRALHPDPRQRIAEAEPFRAQLQAALQALRTEEEEGRSTTGPVSQAGSLPVAQPTTERSSRPATPATPVAAVTPPPPTAQPPRPSPPPMKPATSTAGAPPTRMAATPPPAPGRPPATPPEGTAPVPPASQPRPISAGPVEGSTAAGKRTPGFFHKMFQRGPANKQEPVWLAHRDGLDYGPFTLDELTDRVRKEEFDQTTLVQDLGTGERKPLLEFKVFEEPLARLLREREAKKKEAEAVRSGHIRAAKKMGKGMMFIIILVSSTFVGFWAWFFLKSPEPKELLYAEPMAYFGRPLVLPSLEPAEAIAARLRAEDQRQAAAAAYAREQARLNHVPTNERQLGNADEFANIRHQIDMTAPSTGNAPLSDDEVDRVMRQRLSQFTSCISKELKRNPKLSHATITFWVRGDGSVGGTQIASNGTQRMFGCLKQEISALRFRAHGGQAKKVTFPLQVN